jgi:peptidoglycan/LPS O-acetylase OafA/YrhL
MNPQVSRTNESANLDLLRSIAVTLVVASHVFPFAPWFDRRSLGHVGVALFFVHTTLVLMRSLQRQGGALFPFFVRRFFRIYPLSIAVVLALAGVMTVAGQPPSLRDFLSNVFLVQNLTGAQPMPSPLWTLPFEVQMYVALPAIYALTRLPNRLALVVALWCISLIVAVAAGAHRETTGHLQSSLASFAPCFLPGALAFVLSGRRQCSPLLLFGVIALGVTTLPVAVAYGGAETPSLWLLCAVLGFTIPQCRDLTFQPVALVAKTIAKYSYGVYLLHIFAVGFAFHGRGGTAEWATFAILLAGFAVLAHHAIEVPGMALGARIADRLAALRRSGADENDRSRSGAACGGISDQVDLTVR